MAKETEKTNSFEGFNLLKMDGLEVPSKEIKKPEEDSEKDKKEKEIQDALEKAKQEADRIAAEKEKNKSKSKEEEKKVEDKNSKKKGEEEEEEEVIQNQEEEEEQEEEAPEGSLKPFLVHMANKGILDYEEGEEFDDTEDGLEKIQEKTIKNRVDQWKQSYPEDAQKFLKFIEDGGRPEDFHRLYYENGTFEDFKIDTPENQKYIIKEGLLASGWTEEDADDEIQLYEDAEKLEVKAKGHLSRLQKIEKESKETLLLAQEKFAKEQEEARKQEFNDFKKGLFDSENISGFKFTPKMKQDLWDYMTKPIDRKTGLTEYQKDSKEKGKEARYIFAYLMKNNWDVTKLEEKVKGKVISEVKNNLSKFTDSRNKIKSGSSSKEDKVDTQGKNQFSGFKSYIKN